MSRPCVADGRSGSFVGWCSTPTGIRCRGRGPRSCLVRIAGATEPKIDGIAKSIYDVLQNNRFSIDYYQRQYRWESKRVAELLNDLADKSSEAWDPGLTRSLHQQAYERHPGFGRFVAASGLNFKPYEVVHEGQHP